MAYDEGMAQVLRDDLSDLETVERKMFGGLCFMHRGHMIAGIYKGGAMFRVGKAQMDAACAIPGVAPMRMSETRAMPGMVSADADVLADDARRGAVLSLARGFNLSQPPK